MIRSSVRKEILVSVSGSPCKKTSMQWLVGWNLWDFYGIYGTSMESMRLLWNLWDFYEIYGTSIESMGKKEKPRSGWLVGIYGTSMESMGLLWNLWDFYGIYGTSMESMGLLWNLWDFYGIYGTSIESMGEKGKTEVMLFGTKHKNEELLIETTNNSRVTLDQALFIRDHTDTIFKKASGRLCGSGFDHS